eukprot:COSAG06_NODE_20416_length_796_cov_1.992826_1_plen_162_part_01
MAPAGSEKGTAVAQRRLLCLDNHVQSGLLPGSLVTPASVSGTVAAAAATTAGAGPSGVNDWSVPLTDSRGRRSSTEDDLTFFRDNYTKHEAMVPMRDGVSLFTVVFLPKPGSDAADGRSTHPILLQRTTYSCAPYGPDAWAAPRGPMKTYRREGFIFAQQDV